MTLVFLFFSASAVPADSSISRSLLLVNEMTVSFFSLVSTLCEGFQLICNPSHQTWQTARVHPFSNLINNLIGRHPTIPVLLEALGDRLQAMEDLGFVGLDLALC